jgi:hypothetical protein
MEDRMDMAAEQVRICLNNAEFMERCAANPQADKQYCLGMVETYLRLAAQWESKTKRIH